MIRPYLQTFIASPRRFGQDICECRKAHLGAASTTPLLGPRSYANLWNIICSGWYHSHSCFYKEMYSCEDQINRSTRRSHTREIFLEIHHYNPSKLILKRSSDTFLRHGGVVSCLYDLRVKLAITIYIHTGYITECSYTSVLRGPTVPRTMCLIRISLFKKKKKISPPGLPCLQISAEIQIFANYSEYPCNFSKWSCFSNEVLLNIYSLYLMHHDRRSYSLWNRWFFFCIKYFCVSLCLLSEIDMKPHSPKYY